MTDYKAKFKIGQIVHHKLFDYTGVIFDIDPIFQGSDEWERSFRVRNRARTHLVQAKESSWCFRCFFIFGSSLYLQNSRT